ncbi:MAG: DUF488 family protein [Nitrospiraceae bacterium]
MRATNTQRQHKPRIFSIGHSNHPLERFLSLLREYKIDLLVDTRSMPYSRFAPQFSAEQIQSALEKAGIRYLFLGRELGGRPDEAEYYDSEGHVLYWKLANSSKLREGIRRLEEAVRARRVAIMCSEEDPSSCHRRLLVGRVLSSRGTELEHIRGDGRLQTEDDLIPKGTQNALFEPSEKDVWRSIQSVLQRGQRHSSSGH